MSQAGPCGLFTPRWSVKMPSGWQAALSFTHILQTDCMKEPGKTITIVEVDITSALAIPLSSDFPKMWVKVRALAGGVSESH